MDIAKYIGQYLLKNNYCYIHGLGNLEMKKKPASYDGQALQSSSFEVVVSATGSIDDGLANFIATNEQISISKASNALREFSTQARADLHEGKEVIIPSLGKFIEHNGKIGFITDPHLKYTPPAIPTVKTAPHTEEKKAQPSKPIYTPTPSRSSSSVNWKPIIVISLVVVVIALIAYFGIEYINNSDKIVAEDPTAQQPQDTVVMVPPVADTAATAADTTAKDSTAAVPMQNGMLSFKVILKTYKDSTSANKQAKKYTSYGMTVESVMKDSAYYVVIPVTAAPADTAHILDSLRRTYNPKGVSILK